MSNNRVAMALITRTGLKILVSERILISYFMDISLNIFVSVSIEVWRGEKSPMFSMSKYIPKEKSALLDIDLIFTTNSQIKRWPSIFIIILPKARCSAIIIADPEKWKYQGKTKALLERDTILVQEKSNILYILLYYS